MNPHSTTATTENAYETALRRVMALFSARAIKPHLVDSDRMLDEFGRPGRRFADNVVLFCENGDLRIVIRECSEDFIFWFEVELGYAYRDADSVTLHPLKITYREDESGDHYSTPYAWHLERNDSPESLALLADVDAEIAARCPVSGHRDPPVQLAEDGTSPDCQFYIGLIDKFITHLRVNGVPPGTTTLDVPNPPVQ